ncbi:hypothetical protein ATN88_01630 [Enterovibrio coralii]|uniref:Uncharacterized protein n=1 Tax=Enterovibrio coralii TaxID=294935 RepID=A0A135I7L2_9GAMM|nr:hypothetical protein ATN88_01630 [Enterovibrio coralii]
MNIHLFTLILFPDKNALSVQLNSSENLKTLKRKIRQQYPMQTSTNRAWLTALVVRLQHSETSAIIPTKGNCLKAESNEIILFKCDGGSHSRDMLILGVLAPLSLEWL